MQDPFAIFTYIWTSRASKAAAVVFVLGWLPLLLVIGFGEPDANPIGLGLLAWLSTIAALLLAGIGVARGIKRWRAG